MMPIVSMKILRLKLETALWIKNSSQVSSNVRISNFLFKDGVRYRKVKDDSVCLGKDSINQEPQTSFGVCNCCCSVGFTPVTQVVTPFVTLESFRNQLSFWHSLLCAYLLYIPFLLFLLFCSFTFWFPCLQHLNFLFLLQVTQRTAAQS